MRNELDFSFAESAKVDSHAAFLDAYELRASNKVDSGNPELDREYGKPSPARQQFNEAFREFSQLQINHSDEAAFGMTKERMLDSIRNADRYVEASQKHFHQQISGQFKNQDKSQSELIDKLQLLSSALNQVYPGDREQLMRDLAQGNLQSLAKYPEVKDAYEKIPPESAAKGMPALIKSWLDYRAGLGDSIGQRQVFAGLLGRFGDRQEVRKYDDEVQELKNRVGGRYLY